jgi:prepilin-type N-terminal cleavage/methylation domain-containing protein
MNPRGDHRAFSLLELVIVLAILALLASMAAARFAAASTHYRLDAAARRVAADFALARSWARTTSRSQPVVFQAASGKYQLPNVRPLDTASGTYFVYLKDAPYKLDSVKVDFAGQTTVTFDAYGYPDRGGTVTLEAGVALMKVVLDKTSGKATVQ